MNNREENKLTMYNNLKRVCELNSETWNTLPGFENSYNQLVLKIEGIEKASELQKAIEKIKQKKKA